MSFQGERVATVPRPINRAIIAVAMVGLLSFFLLIYSDILWRDNFRRNVPLLDNLMHARVSLAEAHIRLEEVLSGNTGVDVDEIRRLYRQAAEAADACLQGQSAITALAGLPLEDRNLVELMNRFKWSIERSESIAEMLWQSREGNDTSPTLGRQLRTAYHGSELIAGAVSVNLQRHISSALRAQKNIFRLSLVLWAVILSCLCGALYFVGRKQQKAGQALQESEKQLRILSSHLLTAQEEERKKISLELHDEFGQSLTVLKLQIRGIERQLKPEQAELKNDCSKSLGHIDQIIETARKLSRDLSPSTLEDLGFTNALSCLAEDFGRYADMDMSLDVPDMDGLFGREAEIVIYRIFQEALTNMGKHAEAGQVSISAEKSQNRVFFRIKDDGIGFDPKEVAAGKFTERGLGLTTMHERARMLGGSLEVSSARGEGTNILFTAPIKKGMTQ